MKKLVLARLQQLTNQQVSNMFVVLIAVSVLLTMMPTAVLVAILALAVADAKLSYDFARLIDWVDDNVDFKFEIPKRFHAVYALGTAMVAGSISGVFGAAIVHFPPELYAFVTPRVVFFICGFALSLAGYAVAWRTIPNVK